MIPSELVDDFNGRREGRDSLWLAVVPLGMAVVLGVLLLPRRAVPESVPLPVADARALGRTERADHDLATHARQHPLEGAVRALGSAIRDFHTLEARDAEGRELYAARRAVDVALIDALKTGPEPLLELRAVQLEGFLDEMHRFEATGQQSDELKALAGAFVRSLTLDGWCEDHDVAPDDATLRVMFKRMWSAFIAQEGNAALALTLDEQRTLYAFYLSHAHPSPSMRDALEAARRGARDVKACTAIEEAYRSATEAWRLEHIARLATLDPTYPADYARGVASYRRGDFGASARSFRSWLTGHPEGPLALRAQNYLRAAADAARVE